MIGRIVKWLWIAVGFFFLATLAVALLNDASVESVVSLAVLFVGVPLLIGAVIMLIIYIGILLVRWVKKSRRG